MQPRADFCFVQTLDRYQTLAHKTSQGTEVTGKLSYPVMGLCGEAGELANKVKKIYRDKGGYFEAADVEAIRQELGDVLWYVSEIATVLELSLNDIASANIIKLEKRLKDQTINGEGDNR